MVILAFTYAECKVAECNLDYWSVVALQATCASLGGR